MRVIQIKDGFVSFFILQDQKTILIDTGFPGDVNKKLDAIKNAGVNPKEISLILLTHAHHDHFGNADELRDITGAPIAIHKLDSEYLAKGESSPIKPHGFTGRMMVFFMKLRKKMPPLIIKPDIIFEGEFDLKQYGVDAVAIHTPGHTPGSVSVITSTPEAIVGDMLFASLSNPNKISFPFFIDDLNEVKASIRKVLSYNPKLIYAAHSKPINPDDVKRLIGVS
jgi:hydroxyacylglutathione hydrolase